MNVIDIQAVCANSWQPEADQLQEWVDAALTGMAGHTEITVRIVDEKESSKLNEYYRNKPGPTNILSFPFEPPNIDGLETGLLGDLVVCASVLEQEAVRQQKPLQHHWAHIIVHGVLHLLGYDHINETDAARMEHKEIEILSRLNISNPYAQIIDHE